jgi:signal transduction histidine kinase
VQSKQIRGSGIGLALVKHIAEAHGGRAWCEPVDPRGSAFVLTVKLDEKGGRSPSIAPRPSVV